MTEQERRQKIMGELEACIDDSIAAVVPRDTVLEVIKLLRAKEPIMPIRKPELFESLYQCGLCSAKVGFQVRKNDDWRFKYKFCPNCGNAVKWE